MGGAPSAPPPPAQQQVSQTAEFPEELKPFIDDILERARTRIESRDEEGFQKFPAPRLAEFSPEQSEAQQGISNIARSGISSDPRLSSTKTYMAPALEATASSRGTFDADTASKFMSPYIQNVIDIQKREARRSGELQNQQIADQAVGAGSYGGSRQAFQESERRRNEAQLLDDIQAKGLQSAFETGSAQFEREKGRDLAAGQQYAGLAEQAPRLALAELGALSGVGAAKQEQGQRALDIGYQEFQEELQYPERTLQEYSSIIRGFPLTPNQFGVTQTATPPPNLTTQLAGLAGAGAGAFKAFAKEGGQIKRAEGGETDYLLDDEGSYAGLGEIESPNSLNPPEKEGGLSSLPQQLGRKGYNKSVEEYLQGLKRLKEESGELQKERKALAQEQKKDRARDKFLELAMAGLRIAEGGGKGQGLLDAAIPATKIALGNIGKSRDEERKIDVSLLDSDFKNKMLQLGLDEKQITALSNQRTINVQDLLAKAKLIKAQGGKTKYKLPSKNEADVIQTLAKSFVDGIKDEDKKDRLEAFVGNKDIKNELSVLAKNYMEVDKLSPKEAVAKALNDINESYNYESGIFTDTVSRKS